MSDQEISAGSNVNDSGNLPAESPPPRRLSGFASPDYWTPERKQAKREWAKKAHEEGRFGGRQPGAGRPKTKTVAEVVSEKAAEKADIIARELVDMATKHKSPSVKLGAIDRIHTFEQAVQKNMRDDERELLKLSGKSLDDELAKVLAEHGIGYDYDLPQEDIEEEDDAA